MKTRYIIYLFLCFLGLVSCRKQTGTDTTSPFDSLPAEGKVFRASNAGGSVKSHFQDISQSGQLVWDKSDNLAVYAVNTSSEDMAESAVKGLAYIDPAFDGKVNAEFKSVLTEAQWFEGVSSGESKWFFATYPCYDALAQQPLQKVAGEERTDYILPIYVPSTQNYSAGFQAYQTLVSNGGEYIAGQTVNFGTFTPVTSLIRFKIRSKKAESSCHVSEMSVRFGYETLLSDYLESDVSFNIAGPALLDVNPATKTLTWSTENGQNSWNNAVYLDFYTKSNEEEGLLVTEEYSDYIYIVVLPTRFPASSREPMIQFLAEYYLLWDNHYKGDAYALTVPLPDELHSGIDAGKCYSFAVTLEEGRLSVGYEGSCNMGAYEINTEWGQED